MPQRRDGIFLAYNLRTYGNLPDAYCWTRPRQSTSRSWTAARRRNWPG
jgi:hypothetical protein